MTSEEAIHEIQTTVTRCIDEGNLDWGEVEGPVMEGIANSRHAVNVYVDIHSPTPIPKHQGGGPKK